MSLAFTVRIGNCLVHSRAVLRFGDDHCRECLSDWYWDQTRRLNGVIADSRKTALKMRLLARTSDALSAKEGV